MLYLQTALQLDPLPLILAILEQTFGSFPIFGPARRLGGLRMPRYFNDTCQ